jgi:hypothetical protein
MPRKKRDLPQKSWDSGTKTLGLVGKTLALGGKPWDWLSFTCGINLYFPI